MKLQLKPDREDHHSDDKYDASDLEAQDFPAPNILIGYVALFLSLPILAVAIWLGVQSLTDPLASIFGNEPEQSLSQAVINLNPPQTLEEIKAELATSQFILGEKLLTRTSESVYPILQTDSHEIREIRVYQTIFTSGQDKWRLARKIETSGLDEYFVKAPTFKYNDGVRNFKPQGRQMPLMKLQVINGIAPSQGVWFVALGQDDKVIYGQVFCYVGKPEPTLNMITEWTSPIHKLPEWQNAIASANTQIQDSATGVIKLLANEPELVIDQTQEFEPSFAIYKLEAANNIANPLQLRRINLNESLGMPQIYSDALLLASGGLWSPALTKLDKLKSELQAKNQGFSGFVQEQYDLINLHAKVTAAQAQRPITNSGDQTLMLVVDGRWQEALKIAQASDFTAKSVADMLQVQSPHIWERVKTALKAQPLPEVKIWGALVILQQQGLPAAQSWLQSQGISTKESIALLQKLDQSPLGIQPDQILGTVRFLGRNPGTRWQLPTPNLLLGQAWYEVEISVIRDRNTWVNTPFPQLVARSPVLIWQALGFERTNSMAITITDSNGQRDTLSVSAQSLWVGDEGQLHILASGDQNLPNAFKQAYLAPMVTGGNGMLIGTIGSPVFMQNLGASLQARITRTIYSELQTLGQVSLKPDEFAQQLSGWTFQSVELTGSKEPDLVLEIDRSKIDLGNRYYPLAIAFNSDGKLLFSSIPANSNRRWINILPSTTPGQILTEINGRYEVWSLR